MPKKSDSQTTTYEHETTIPKYNLTALSESDIVNQIEYLLFVDHEEDMKGYTHLRPLIEELAQLTIRTADRAVNEFQMDMTSKIAVQLQDVMQGEIAKVVYDARIETSKKATVKVVIDDEKIVSQTVEPHHDW